MVHLGVVIVRGMEFFEIIETDGLMSWVLGFTSEQLLKTSPMDLPIEEDVEVAKKAFGLPLGVPLRIRWKAPEGAIWVHIERSLIKVGDEVMRRGEVYYLREAYLSGRSVYESVYKGGQTEDSELEGRQR